MATRRKVADCKSLCEGTAARLKCKTHVWKRRKHFQFSELKASGEKPYSFSVQNPTGSHRATSNETSTSPRVMARCLLPCWQLKFCRSKKNAERKNDEIIRNFLPGCSGFKLSNSFHQGRCICHCGCRVGFQHYRSRPYKGRFNRVIGDMDVGNQFRDIVQQRLF